MSDEELSCFPPTWRTQKRRCLNFTAENESKRKCRSHMVDIILKSIENCIKRGPATSACDETFIKTIVDSLPFAELLKNVNSSSLELQLPIITKNYEEKFMRECLNSTEAKCAMGNECECMYIDDQERFIGVQFVFPDIETYSTSTRNNLCVLCLRKTTQLLYYKTVHEGVLTKSRIQKYGNICGVPGEYHQSAMLICPPGVNSECMPYPIVAHQRNRYSVVKVGNVRHIKQERVYFEDFV